MADDNRIDLIYGKDRLLAPLQAGCSAAAPMAPGTTDEDYYRGSVFGGAAESVPGSEEVDVVDAATAQSTALLAAEVFTRTSTGEAVQFWISVRQRCSERSEWCARPRPSTRRSVSR